MKSFIDKIKEFESGTAQTVEAFNSLFPESPLNWSNERANVDILGIAGPFNVRDVLVDGCRKRHEFIVPVKGDNYHDNEDYIEVDDTKKYLKDYPTNLHSDNDVLTDSEMKLGPFEYFILQYLRGCANPYHTYVEISQKLTLADKTIIKYVKQMQAKGMIEVNPEIKGHRVFIKILGDWR